MAEIENGILYSETPTEDAVEKLNRIDTLRNRLFIAIATVFVIYAFFSTQAIRRQNNTISTLSQTVHSVSVNQQQSACIRGYLANYLYDFAGIFDLQINTRTPEIVKIKKDALAYLNSGKTCTETKEKK